MFPFFLCAENSIHLIDELWSAQRHVRPQHFLQGMSDGPSPSLLQGETRGWNDQTDCRLRDQPETLLWLPGQLDVSERRTWRGQSRVPLPCTVTSTLGRTVKWPLWGALAIVILCKSVNILESKVVPFPYLGLCTYVTACPG